MDRNGRFDKAIKVASVEAEYRRVALTRCSNCGNKLEMKKQTLETNEQTGRHYDVLETTCVQCGKAHEFLFDISSFFGKPQSE